MAFNATYVLKLNRNPNVTPVTVSQAGCYFKINGIRGGKEAGIWETTIHVYVNQATRVNDISDYILGADFYVSTPYVANQDPYPALYEAAKAGYGDATDVIEAVQ